MMLIQKGGRTCVSYNLTDDTVLELFLRLNNEPILIPNAADVSLSRGKNWKQLEDDELSLLLCCLPPGLRSEPAAAAGVSGPHHQ